MRGDRVRSERHPLGYVRILAVSDLTEELCRMRNMEKEHSTKSQSARLDNHIVAGPD